MPKFKDVDFFSSSNDWGEGLAELDQTSADQMALCVYDVKKEEYRNVMPWVRCREFITDAIVTMLGIKEPYSIYGFNTALLKNIKVEDTFLVVKDTGNRAEIPDFRYVDCLFKPISIIKEEEETYLIYEIEYPHNPIYVSYLTREIRWNFLTWTGVYDHFERREKEKLAQIELDAYYKTLIVLNYNIKVEVSSYDINKKLFSKLVSMDRTDVEEYFKGKGIYSIHESGINSWYVNEIKTLMQSGVTLY